jgi:type I restriction enzyme S subunit
MSVPKLRFPEFRDAGEWEEKPLGEVADVSKLAGYEFTKHIIYEESGHVIALRGLNLSGAEKS